MHETTPVFQGSRLELPFALLTSAEPAVFTTRTAIRFFLQNYGLANIPQAREEPMLNPETLWRIRPDMNVASIAPPVRKINRPGIAVLKERRAGNRGKSKRLKTTPVCG